VNTMSQNSRSVIGAGLAAAAALLLLPTTVQAIDWGSIPERKLELFHPGQASWEWALSASDHSGAPKFREGKNCGACHKGEERDIGAAIASGKKLEPKPIPGKAGSLTLRVKAAHDGDRLYFRLQWKPGAAPASRMDPDFAARVTMMLDDGSVREATRAGCWSSCHDDAMGMASAPAGGKIEKYLGASRTKLTRQGGGTNYKPAAALDQMMAQGQFLEYWQAQLNPGKAAKAVGGHILDRRHRDASSPVRAEAEFRGGEWIVTLSRPLQAAGRGQTPLAAGKTYTVAFAVHDGFSDHRHHYVSLENTLALDSGKADFVAGKR
jgi:hypothetical protein